MNSIPRSMSCQQDDTTSLFQLTYASALGTTCHASADKIVRAKSIRLHRCRESKCCRCKHDELHSEKLALFVPPALTHQLRRSDGNYHEKQSDLMKAIHPCLCEGNIATCTNSQKQDKISLPPLVMSTIIISDKNSSLPSDVAIFELDNIVSNGAAKKPNQYARDILLQYSSILNHETASGAPCSVLKAFPIQYIISNKLEATNGDGISAKQLARNDDDERLIDGPELPCCPVCLHRIEPLALGLPDFQHKHKCSPWCSTFNQSCANEMKLEPWPPPAHCIACEVISQRDSTLEVEPAGYASTRNNTVSSRCLQCHRCGMTTTLWVCLTCGIIGCGRYTLKHAADHFTSSGHPYSLELATMRIWDYENGAFVHRRDLLECPVLSMKWGNNPYTSDSMQFTSPLLASSRSTENESLLSSPRQQHLKNDEALNTSAGYNGVSPLQPPQPASCQSSLRQNNVIPDKLSHPPKKSMMVSEEYEVLLQSALEDQALHFEVEISRLRSELASARMEQSQCISEEDSREIDGHRKDIDRLKFQNEDLSSALLEIQSEESKNRALSQKLLREQSISKELLEKLRNDIRLEHDLCRQRLEDLELQIDDLTANLRMRTQIQQSEELNQAQIFGTTGVTNETCSNRKKGKKSLRFGRRK